VRTILVDIEERRSAVPGHLEALGVAIELVGLPEGDYVIGDCAIERKTVADLHRSVATGRLWQQVAALKSLSRAYVLVEGINLDAGPITAAGIRGVLLQVMDNGLAVIRSSSSRDTAAWLRLLAVRNDRPHVARGRRRRRRAVVSPGGVLAAVPGISPVTGHALLARFGSLAGVAAAPVEQLQEVDGIGPRRADALRRALVGTPSRSEGVS
jgi:ERCC4-type nuclease